MYQRYVLSIPVKTISLNLSVSRSTVRRTLRRFDSQGTVEKKAYSCASRKKMSANDQLHLLELVLENPGMYLKEMKKELQARGTYVDESTVCMFLKESRFSRKKMRLVAIQQSEELRARYLAEFALYSPDMLVFVDETGSNRKDAMRKFGYSLRGQRCICKKLLVRGQRVSAIAALSTIRVLDVKFVHGSVNGETFSKFIELNLLPHLLPFNGCNPNSIVVLDNASIHYHEKVLRLISSVGALLIYLPPYSPDLNPIEEAFSSAKYYLKANEQIASSPEDIENILLSAFANVTPEDCTGWYHHSGYIK